MNLLRQRLYNQHLAGTPLERPEDVVRRLCAVQSQDYLGAKWSVGQRIRRGTDAAVDAAFSAGRILRTHILRPTWHFVAPEDIRWMLRLTSPRVHACNAYRYRQLELDAGLLRRCHDRIAHSLEGGNQLTRTELAKVLRRSGVATNGQRLAYIVMYAELEGLICSGALRGKQHTYALLEERAPATRPLEPDEALAELTRRFFTGHGPATMEHFVWWSGLTVARARAGLSLAQAHLTKRSADGRTYWLGPSRRAAGETRLTAHLLPEYDEAILGYKDLSIPDLPRANARKKWQDFFYRPVIIGGKRAGTWRRRFVGRGVVLDTNLFASLDGAQHQALEAAADRYAGFIGMPVRLG